MKIRNLELKNEFIMAPVKTGYSDGKGNVTEKILLFYKRRARDIAAIIPEPFYLDSRLREIPTQMGIDNDDKLDGLRKLTDIIHKEGAKVIAHLNHPGRMANPKIPGNIFYSSTDKACENGGAKPTNISKDEINNVIELFKNTAIRAEKAGFDMLELQFGHGYLVAQFISPGVNERDDEYGGSFENRSRLALEILKTVKEVSNLPIIIRISGDEMMEKGIKLVEMKKFAFTLEENGADAIHVSAGTVCSTPPWYFQHMFIPKGKTWALAREIKNSVNIPVIAVGQINEFKDINKIKEEKMADFIAIGRAMIADPDFVGKYYANIKGAMIPCLSCTAGCLGGVKAGEGLQCLVNPTIGKESEPLNPADKSKHFAVIGGGLAGMEAAVILKERGHDVTIYEKDELGGQFNLAPLTPYKKSMGKLVPYFKERLKEDNIKIIYKEAEKEDLVSKYDGVILATGSKSAIPPIPGLEDIEFYWAEILREENLPENKNIFIIGGGLIGVDIATALIPKNNKITIVKRTTDFGEDMEMITKLLSLKMMKDNNVVFSDHTYINKIEGNTIYAERNGEKIQFNDIDIIVVSTGMKSYNPLEVELKDEIPVYVVGDAVKPGNAQIAISSAYDLAKTI
jgi:2,4-dienoyl-CoA reductase (NADPH2)